MAKEKETPPEGGGGYQKVFKIALAMCGLLPALLSFPGDDGLRHVGFAFSEVHSWAEVYPFSAFAEHPKYDPWWGHDLVLRVIAGALQVLPLHRLTLQFILVKSLTLTAAGVFLWLAVSRSKIAEAVSDRRGFTSAILVLALIVSVPLSRVVLIRPFVYGSLYILFVLGSVGAWRGAAAAALLAFLYPYLFWIYTLPVAAANVIKGRRSLGVATFTVTAVAILVQPSGFWGMMQALFRAEQVRSQIGKGISEFTPITGEPLLGILLLTGWLIAVPILYLSGRRIEPVHLLLALFFMPISMRHVRYLIDIEFLLFFVVFGRQLAVRLKSFIAEIGGWWIGAINSMASRGADAQESLEGKGSQGLVLLNSALLIVLITLAGYVSWGRMKYYQDLKVALSAVPEKSVVLTEFNMQYKLIYVRPDIKVLPSCELGFVGEEIKEEYVNYLNKGNVCALMEATQAVYFVEAGGQFVDPRNTECLIIDDEIHLARGKPLTIWRARTSI